MEKELHTMDVGVAVQVINPTGVERTCSPDDAVNFIALAKKQFGKVRTVLAGNPGDECFFQECL